MSSYIRNTDPINLLFSDSFPEFRGVFADRWRPPTSPNLERRKEPGEPFTIEQLRDWYAGFVADRLARGIPEDGLSPAVLRSEPA